MALINFDQSPLAAIRADAHNTLKALADGLIVSNGTLAATALLNVLVGNRCILPSRIALSIRMASVEHFISVGRDASWTSMVVNTAAAIARNSMPSHAFKSALDAELVKSKGHLPVSENEVNGISCVVFALFCAEANARGWPLDLRAQLSTILTSAIGGDTLDAAEIEADSLAIADADALEDTKM